MKGLIILRGPDGAGGTTVSEILVQKIDENDVCVLNLDITDSDEQRFKENLKDCLRYNNVIGMMFYGKSHIPTVSQNSRCQRDKDRNCK